MLGQVSEACGANEGMSLTRDVACVNKILFVNVMVFLWLPSIINSSAD